MARKGDKTVKKVKRTISLDVDLSRRLASFAGHHGLDRSAVVADALRSHMAGFRSGGGYRDKADGAEVRLVDPDVEASRKSA